MRTKQLKANVVLQPPHELKSKSLCDRHYDTIFVGQSTSVVEWEEKCSIEMYANNLDVIN